MQWKWPAGWQDKLGKYKYLLLAVLIGVLLLLPSGKGEQNREVESRQTMQQAFDLERMERRLETALSKINGAGRVTVVLTLKDSGRNTYAQDIRTGQQEQSRTTVVVGRSGEEGAIPVQQFTPTFQGALAVCQGGGDPGVRLELTRAISALTGLSTEKISVCQSE